MKVQKYIFFLFFATLFPTLCQKRMAPRGQTVVSPPLNPFKLFIKKIFTLFCEYKPHRLMPGGCGALLRAAEAFSMRGCTIKAKDLTNVLPFASRLSCILLQCPLVILVGDGVTAPSSPRVIDITGLPRFMVEYIMLGRQ